MEWFHCNKCFIRRGSTFAVSTCGHICCEACIKSSQAAKCGICGASCKYIPITDKMKPQDKMFFMDPVELLVSRLERVLQITDFQRAQMERTTAYFKHKSVELEKCLKEVTQQSYRQIAELKRENADLKSQNMELQREMAQLKKPLSQRVGSPSPFQTNGVRRISLPVAVTPPVTAHSRTISPMWPRNRGLGLASRRVKYRDRFIHFLKFSNILNEQKECTVVELVQITDSLF
ncbi:RING finger protein 212B-like isoform X1 [Syngnathus typhle]|uniref:RING finger protein 212B-like isoform X1 n=1 Tax=Syngnathus typhle TaxID=161592 RepID=UPI002A6A3993|nr:RING finger protein 212B-like isoform X1 [Syngnathus typhle]XP_061151355.1 RING finger protein 212B-like isoform X1 [Syngnathus typhle]